MAGRQAGGWMDGRMSDWATCQQAVESVVTRMQRHIRPGPTKSAGVDKGMPPASRTPPEIRMPPLQWADGEGYPLHDFLPCHLQVPVEQQKVNFIGEVTSAAHAPADRVCAAAAPVWPVVRCSSLSAHALQQRQMPLVNASRHCAAEATMDRITRQHRQAGGSALDMSKLL